jgi:hypothetical protein
MRQWLAPAHLVLTLVIIVWNIILAGRIAQVRHATRGFALISGFAALMLLPAFIVALATTTLITGRAIASIDWVWPATVVLFAVQAVYAVSRKLVNPLWGYPIAFYDVVVAIAALARYATAHGVDVPYPFLIVMAAQIDALALATTEAAIASPFFLHVPFIAPAFPAIGRATAGIRAGVAGLALLWFGLILAEMPRANQALSSYAAHADDRLTERADRFPVGVKIFPDLHDQLSGASARADIELATATTVNAIHVVLVPGATALAIDSVGRAIDLLQRDSVQLVVTIGYSGTLLPEIGKGELEADVRLQTLHRALTRLRPDIVVPAQDPYGIGARVLGRLPVTTWQEFYTRARARGAAGPPAHAGGDRGVGVRRAGLHPVRVGGATRKPRGRRRFLVLPESARCAIHGRGLPRRRSVDGRASAREAALGARHRRLSPGSRRGKSRARDLGDARVGDFASADPRRAGDGSERLR